MGAKGMSEYAMTPADRRKLSSAKRSLGGYAAVPGTGPEGETCGTCLHLCRRGHAKAFFKCGLMRAKWTCGGGTDIKSRAPACCKWEAVK